MLCYVFFLPLSYSASPLPMFRLEFRGEVNREETCVQGQSPWSGRRWQHFNRPTEMVNVLVDCL